MHTMQKKRFGVVAAGLFGGAMLISLMGGCVSIGASHPAIPLVTIRQHVAEAPVCATPWPLQLGVAFPESVNNLRTDRIALLFHEREIRYLSNAKWESHTSMLFSRSLVRALESSGCFKSVGSDFSGQSSGLRLESSIDMFHLVYFDDSPIPTATLEMRLTLLDKGSGEALGTTVIRQTAQASSEKTDALLNAMDAVMNSAMQDTARWVSQTITAQMPLLKKMHRL